MLLPSSFFLHSFLSLELKPLLERQEFLNVFINHSSQLSNFFLIFSMNHYNQYASHGYPDPNVRPPSARGGGFSGYPQPIAGAFSGGFRPPYPSGPYPSAILPHAPSPTTDYRNSRIPQTHGGFGQFPPPSPSPVTLPPPIGRHRGTPPPSPSGRSTMSDPPR